jgi:hypothetical protein
MNKPEDKPSSGKCNCKGEGPQIGRSRKYIVPAWLDDLQERFFLVSDSVHKDEMDDEQVEIWIEEMLDSSIGAIIVQEALEEFKQEVDTPYAGGNIKKKHDPPQ